MFVAVMALTFGVEIVVFSPARRASRKLLERMQEARARPAQPPPRLPPPPCAATTRSLCRSQFVNVLDMGHKVRRVQVPRPSFSAARAARPWGRF